MKLSDRLLLKDDGDQQKVSFGLRFCAFEYMHHLFLIISESYIGLIVILSHKQLYDICWQPVAHSTDPPMLLVSFLLSFTGA